MAHWNPPVEPSRREEVILKRLKRHRRLFSFVRRHRHNIFDADFQQELDALYRNSGAGLPPVPPAQLCVAVLFQAYVQASDAEAVELAFMDARWQMVLDCMGCDEPPFSQGTLQSFRARLIENDMDRRLLERIVEFAQQVGDRGAKAIFGKMRLAVDSRPLEGAGRVEDTINLLGHAARKIAEAAACFLEVDYRWLCEKAGILCLVSAPSVKAALDLDWNIAQQKADGLADLHDQIERLVKWVENNCGSDAEGIETLRRIQAQDLEFDANGRPTIRKGVAPDRQISIEDPDMRHGRKSKSTRVDGYKEHVATDMESKLILSCAVTPANRPEGEAGPAILSDLEQQGVRIAELQIDRGYVNSDLVDSTHEVGGEVRTKAWPTPPKAPGLFAKTAFNINMRTGTVTCPNGVVVPIVGDAKKIRFSSDDCGPCPIRDRCTQSKSGRGRSIQIADDETFQKKLRRQQSTSSGRAKLRERTLVEHSLAHIANRKGPRARYFGTRSNLFDLRRTAAIYNLEVVQRGLEGNAKHAA